MSFSSWWIKVCPGKMEAPWFDVIAGPDSNNIVYRHRWNKGDSDEFELSGCGQFGQVYVAGYSGQNDKNTYFGVCYGDQVCCKHYDFDHDEAHGGEDHDVKSSDTDEWKCD